MAISMDKEKFQNCNRFSALCEQFTHRSACKQRRRVSNGYQGFYILVPRNLGANISFFIYFFFSSRISYSKNVLNILNH